MKIRGKALQPVTVATVGLSTLLSVASLVLTGSLTQRSIISIGLPLWAILPSLCAVFIFVERSRLNVEYHSQAHILTLGGIPLTIGLLIVPPWMLVLVRSLCPTLVNLACRQRPDKVYFNFSNVALESALAATLLQPVVAGATDVTLKVGVAVIVVSITVDILSALLVQLVIGINGGSTTIPGLFEALGPAVAVSVATGSFAVGATLLLKSGPVGYGLVLGTIVALVIAYRAYTVFARRHKDLGLLHAFVSDGVGADSVEVLSLRMLTRVRDVMKAQSVELTILSDVTAGGVVGAQVLSVDEGGGLLTRDASYDTADDGVWAQVLLRKQSVLAGVNTKDPQLRSWMRGQGVSDALVTPVSADDDFAGALLVANRLGETSTFTGDDLELLQTLTGHMAVAMRSTQLVDRLRHDSTHDSLTNLHNRAYLNARLTALAGTTFAVLLMDLDRFKEVNDTLGHEVGDRLLVAVADRLTAVVPAGAVVARLGGDEFAILLPDPADGLNTALGVARRILAALAEKIRFDQALLAARASIGAALSAPGMTGSEMLRRADTAMYSAKSSEAGVAAYDSDMDRERLEQVQLVADLRTALDSDPGQLSLHYQPKINLDTGEVLGVEALARWAHPGFGNVQPDRFIHLAESSGLIGQLTSLVLDTALADCAIWTAFGHKISVAINLSARNIENAALPGLIADRLAAAGVDPEQLIIEITESSVIGDPRQAVPVLHQLNDMGVKVSLDDFGTGYSSLSYLQRLPVAEVKIDRSFVVGLDGADVDNARVLISSITGLGANLGLRVVAEGVEDAERLTELRKLGCHIAQGYYISRPLPMEALLDWLAAYDAAAMVA